MKGLPFLSKIVYEKARCWASQYEIFLVTPNHSPRGYAGFTTDRRRFRQFWIPCLIARVWSDFLQRPCNFVCNININKMSFINSLRSCSYCCVFLVLLSLPRAGMYHFINPMSKVILGLNSNMYDPFHIVLPVMRKNSVVFFFLLYTLTKRFLVQANACPSAWVSHSRCRCDTVSMHFTHRKQ